MKPTILHIAYAAPSLWLICGMAIQAQTPNVYAVDEINNNVTIINSATNTVVTTLQNLIPGIPAVFNAGPCHVAVTPDGTQAFVTNFNGTNNPLLNVVTAIDTTTNRTATIPIDSNMGTYHPAISPDSRLLYVPANTGQNFLMLVIDTGTKAVIRRFGLDGSPGRMAFTADGSQLWVPFLGDTKIEILDPASGRVLNKKDFGAPVDAIAMSPDGTTAYISTNGVFVVDVASLRTLSMIPTTETLAASGFVDLAISPDGKRLYVSQPANNGVAVIDIASQNETTPLPASSFGEAAMAPFAISRDGTKLFTQDACPFCQGTPAHSIAAWSTSSFTALARDPLAPQNSQNAFQICGVATQPFAFTAPMPNVSAVVNGASPQVPIAAGAWTTIYGTNLSRTTRGWTQADFSGSRLPVSLDGVSVSIDGLPAYVSYVSPSQINVLSPDDPATGAVPVVVSNSLGNSTAFTVTKAQFSPALFTWDGKHPIAAHADGSLIGPAGLLAGVATTPAKPGETIVLYGTGFGPTNPPLPANSLVTVPEPLANPVTMTMNNTQTSVLYAGVVLPGVAQFNVVVPNLPDGDSAVLAKIGSAQTQSALVIAIKQ